MNDQTKYKRNRHYCYVFQMSKKKRTEMAQTQSEDLKRGDAHPTIDGLLFHRYTPNRTEAWVTLEELNENQDKATERREAKQTPKQRKAAEKARKLKLKHDLEADAILLRFSRLGMPLEAFKALPKPVRNRVVKACPDIVTNEEQREARRDAHMDALKELCDDLHKANVLKMEAKMQAIRNTERVSEDVPVLSFSEMVAAQKAKSVAVTQADLNKESRFAKNVPCS